MTLYEFNALDEMNYNLPDETGPYVVSIEII